MLDTFNLLDENKLGEEELKPEDEKLELGGHELGKELELEEANFDELET